MFRKLRRADRALQPQEAVEILQKGSYGVLGVAGDGGYPYTVPLNYVYAQGKLLFHCAQHGHKLDALARHDKVSFCVVARSEVVPQAFTTHYRSAVAFGRARVLLDEAEKRRALALLNQKYAPGEAGGAQEIEKELKAVGIVEICIEHLCAKGNV